jgi:hypothetical protein
MGESRSRMKLTQWLIVVLALSTAVMVAAETEGVGRGKQQKCVLPDRINEERPDPEGSPTTVSAALRLMDISKIDDVNQTAELDFYIRVRWKDPRLAPYGGCQFPLDAVWNPEIILMNSGRVFPAEPNRVKIGKGGAVTYLQRFRGALKVPKRLDDFPMDRATFQVSFISRDFSEEQVQLAVDEQFTGRRKLLSVPDWSIGSARGRVGSLHIEVYDQDHSRFDFDLEAKRLAGYYVWKVILPLILIVFMSWVVFWINPAHFGPQIGMSATSMLTLIAFQFAMGNLLPRVNYFTRMDQFILGSTILVFLALVEALSTSYMVTIDKKEPALRLDRICRWAFPLAFACLIGFAFFA